MISDVHRRLRGIDDARPDVSFLRDSFDDVVIPVKGEECAELHPAVAEFLVGVAVEAAGIDAKHGDAEEGKGEGLRDGEEHVGEEGGVVATPVTGPYAAACESGAADDEGSFSWDGFQKGLVGSVQDLVAE